MSFASNALIFPHPQQAGKVGQITRLLARMEEDYPPVPPNAYTFITATTACLQAGAFDKLFEVGKQRHLYYRTSL